MSIDLRRPLVPSMGQHDPLDGFLTCDELRITASALGSAAGGPQLQDELDGLAEMVASGDLMTDDPLGIGGLLDGRRLGIAAREPRRTDGRGARVEGAGGSARGPHALRTPERFGNRPAGGWLSGSWGWPSACAPWEAMPDELARMAGRSPSPQLVALVEALGRDVPLTETIVPFWLDPHQQRAATWSEHLDINEVMLAANLVADGMVVL